MKIHPPEIQRTPEAAQRAAIASHALKFGANAYRDGVPWDRQKQHSEMLAAVRDLPLWKK